MTSALLRFGFSAPPGLPGEVEWASRVDALGASILLMGEGPTVFQDPWLHLGRLAGVTMSARLGTSVTMPGLRHPATLARTASTLNRLSGGRAVLGLGAGDFGVRDLGIRPATVEQLRLQLTLLRALASGAQVDIEGHAIQLKDTGQPLPIWLGADGPRALRLAGHLADGVIVSNGAHPDVVAHALRHVRAGASEAGRSMNDIEVWFLVRTDLATDSSAAVGMEKPRLAEYVARLARFVLRSAPGETTEERCTSIRSRRGIALDVDEMKRLERYVTEYDDRAAYHVDSNPNVRLLAELGLLDRMASLFFVLGEDQEVRTKLSSLVDEGAHNLCFPQVEPERAHTSTILAEMVRRWSPDEAPEPNHPEMLAVTRTHAVERTIP